MTFSADSLMPYLAELQSASRCYIGFSGGLDSHVLLHALCKIVPASSLTAVHVNHQLSPNAAFWEQHCQRVCEALGVVFISQKVTVTNSGGGVEEAARQARYRIFESLLELGDLLLLAHHRDDQAETVLYRLLRGAGPGGLAGMPERRALGQGRLLRPLLTENRQALYNYAIAEKLQWIDDESNDHLGFDRNFLRHKVIAPLAERWPDYGSRLAHSATLCAEADSLLRDLADSDLAALDPRDERVGYSIRLNSGLLTLRRERQANVLRRWLASKGFSVPGHKLLETIQTQMTYARRDAVMQVAWRDGSLRKFRDRLYLLPRVFEQAFEIPWAPLKWSAQELLELPDGSRLEAEKVMGAGFRLLEGQTYCVKFRTGGERCMPQHRGASTTLKKLFQEYDVEPWLRDRAPLVYCGEALVAVADLWVCQPFAVADNEVGCRLRWRY